MVSSINSIRQWSSQAALNAFKETTDTRTSSLSSSGSSSSSLADIFYSGNDDGNDYEDTQLAALIASLQQAMNGGKTGDMDADAGDVGDMSSKAFMTALRQKLEGLKASPDTKAMADEMLAALDAGTLTVTDAVNGEQVKAWDVTDSKQLSAAKTEVDKADWSSYLKGILNRDSDGKFVRAEDGSYTEKKTGASGFFGMIGEAYYYVSWTTPPATTTGTSGNGTASNGGSSTK